MAVRAVCFRAFTDTSSIQPHKELYGFSGNFQTVLAHDGPGSLVCVQVVELKKSRRDAARTQEKWRNLCRREVGWGVCTWERPWNHQHSPAGTGEPTWRDTQVLPGGSVLCQRHTKWHGKTFAEEERLPDSAQHRHLEQVFGIVPLEVVKPGSHPITQDSSICRSSSVTQSVADKYN